MEKYIDLSREELIKRLETLELEKEQSLHVYEDLEKMQRDYQSQEKLAILKAAVNVGDSLIWEYDVKNDIIHLDYELNIYGGKNSRLKIEPFRKKEDFLKTIYPEDRQNVFYDHFIRLIKGEISSYSIRYRRLFGNEVIWVEANVQPYKYNEDGTPSHIVYYLSDVTEQKNLQDKIYQLENKYRNILNATQDAVMTMTEDGRIIDVYAGSMENLLKSPEVLKGSFVSDWLKPDVVNSFHSAIKKTIEVQKEQNISFSIPLKNGNIKYFFCRIIPYAENEVVVIARDASTFVQSRQRVDFLNNLMRAILDNIPVVVVVKEIEKDFRFLYFNSAAEHFMGLTTGAVLGKNDFELFTDKETAERIREQDVYAIKNGQSVQYAVDYKMLDGKSKIVNIIRVKIDSLAESDSPLLISMIWDITHDRENEIELIKAREADKMKSAFLANMSHEIRTPLNAIVGFSSLLPDAANKEEQQEFISIINKNNTLLLQLIDDILDISKIEAGRFDYIFTDVDLKEICMDVYSMHALEVTPEVKMIFAPEHPSLILHTDGRRIEQVLSNFLTNAIKFTKKGSITISYVVRSTDVYVSVEDTGMGISKEGQKAIFDRFVKLDSYQQGTGLGLTISKTIIRQLGGEIGVVSEEGKGATFWFTLPLPAVDK